MAKRKRDKINQPTKKEALDRIQMFVEAFQDEGFTIFNTSTEQARTAEEIGKEFINWYKQWYSASFKKLKSL